METAYTEMIKIKNISVNDIYERELELPQSHWKSYEYPLINSDDQVGDGNLLSILPEDEVKILFNWIKESFSYSRTVWGEHTSYSLKHVFEHDPVGFYLTNDQFKAAMLIYGHEPVDEKELNWRFRVRFSDLYKARENLRKLELENEQSKRLSAEFAFLDHVEMVNTIVNEIREKYGDCRTVSDIIKQSKKEQS